MNPQPLLKLTSERLLKHRKEAIKLMDAVMSKENIDNESYGRSNMRQIEAHLSHIGISLGNFPELYFAPTAVEAEKSAKTKEYKFECGRPFATPQALSGHRPHCPKKGGSKK